MKPTLLAVVLAASLSSVAIANESDKSVVQNLTTPVVSLTEGQMDSISGGKININIKVTAKDVQRGVKWFGTSIGEGAGWLYCRWWC